MLEVAGKGASTRRRRWCPLVARAARVALAGVWVAAAAAGIWLAAAADGQWAWAEVGEETGAVRAVIDRLRLVIISLATTIATLFLTMAGLRWLMAGGDPGEVDKAKRSLTGAGIGYGIAVLATVLMSILDFVVAGGE